MKRSRVLAATMMVALWASCATTHIVNRWRAPDAGERPMRRALVVAVMPDEATRRSLEEHLAAELQKQGVEAVTSSEFIPNVEGLNRDSVRAIAEGHGFDSAVVARFRGVQLEAQYVPGAFGWNDYWAYPNPWLYSPGYVETQQLARVETSAFEVPGGKLLWTALSETVEPTRKGLPVGSVASRVVKEMQKDGLI